MHSSTTKTYANIIVIISAILIFISCFSAYGVANLFPSLITLFLLTYPWYVLSDIQKKIENASNINSEILKRISELEKNMGAKLEDNNNEEQWQCKTCGTYNKSSSSSCKDCGATK